MLPIRVPRLDGPKSLRYLPRRVVQAMADHASANLLLGERTVPGRFVVLRLAVDEVEREELERQFAESYEVILQEITREAKARDFRLRGDLAVRLRTFLEATVDRRQAADAGEASRSEDGTDGENGVVSSDASPVALPLPPRIPPSLAPELWARLLSEREVILPEKLRTLLVESRPSGAAVYLDNRQVERVTPCRAAEVPAGAHALLLALPGFLPHETTVEVPEEGDGEIRVSVDLEAEPPMGVLEVVTFPSQATATVEDAPGATAPISRTTPCRLRLPAGRVRVRIEHADYEPQEVEYELPAGNEGAPGRLQVRLLYAGDDRDQTVGRLIIYKPESSAPTPADVRPLDRPEETIASFFRDQGVDLEDASRVTMGTGPPAAEPEVLGERPITKGVLLIGRQDRQALVAPDVKLFDAANTVTRGCHAWLHVYTDPGTGAEFNTFVIHNNSPSGTLVNGRLVMESAALGDEAELRIGIFRMRIVKETPAPRVEF
jgi:hypothetical protein